MTKKGIIFFIVCAFLILICGCHTITETFKGTAKGISAGIKKDWDSVKKADEWMRENLW